MTYVHQGAKLDIFTHFEAQFGRWSIVVMTDDKMPIYMFSSEGHMTGDWPYGRNSRALKNVLLVSLATFETLHMQSLHQTV